MEEEYKFYMHDTNNLDENKHEHLIPLASKQSPPKQKERQKKVIHKTPQKIQETTDTENNNF